MSDIYIAGVGMTQFGRQLDRSLKDLSADACARAFADAGCGREDIEAVFFGNCVQGHMEGQDMIRGERDGDCLCPVGYGGHRARARRGEDVLA